MRQLVPSKRFGLMVVAMVLVMGLGCAVSDAQRRKGRGRMHRPDYAPALGADAPGFTLKPVDGKSEVELASFQGDKPVVLVFGSYT